MTNNSGNFSLDGRIGRGKYLKELAIYITLSILLAVVALIVGIAIFFAGGGGGRDVNRYYFPWFSTNALLAVPRIWGEALS